jgi:hypothetical protein
MRTCLVSSTVVVMFFGKMKGVHRNIGVQKDFETLLFNTVYNIWVFASLAFKFQKSTNRTYTLFVSKI